ncbi:prion-inhibition and propagation domain-containing protein [Trichoderma sp. SZMC 28015]
MATSKGNGTERAADLTQLWLNAVAGYEKKTKKSLQKSLQGTRPTNNMQSMMENLENGFQEFRHDRSKLDRMRNVFKDNLWLIQKVVDTVEVAGSVTSTFPPTMPASIVFTAFKQVMQSFTSMSTDYDKIIGFFDFTRRFLDRLSMIEKTIPQQKSLQICITRVFSGMLTICSIAQEYAEKKRLKKWFSNLIDGSDETLSVAVKDMEDAVNELNQTVGLATFQSAKMLSEIIQQMNENIDERMKAIKLDTEATIEQNKELKSKQDDMIEMQRSLLEKVDEQSRLFNTTVQSFGFVHMGVNFREIFRVSLLKFDVVRLRLARWGHSAGLVSSDGVDSFQATKLAFENRDQAQSLLDQILELFADARVASKKFEKRNGNSALLTLNPAEELDGVSALLHQKMQDFVEKRQGKLELEQSEWTLHEEKKFSRLIEDISELVDDLIDLFPGIQEEQRRLCEEEVSEMNMNKGMLLLLKDIAAGQDKLLSDTAAKAIKPTTTYTNSVVFSGSHNSGLQIGNNLGSISGINFGRW